MKNIYLIAVLTVVLMLFAGSALATPGRTTCNNCHSVSNNVTVTADSAVCNGDQGTFTVSVSSNGNGAEGYAVFSGNSNVANGSGTSGSFTLPNGSYAVWGVSMDGGGMGGSNSDSVIIDCSVPACTDDDRDGFSPEGGDCGPVDCDDSDAAIHPDAVEVCTDGIDNDCDGLIDDLDPNATACSQCTDDDRDGYSPDGGDCGPVDCDDSDRNVHPGAIEVCTDGIDNDCDGLIDGEGLNASICPTCTDFDNDGFYAEGGSCGPRDCDDSLFVINPDATEVCDNGIDDNCDGLIDENDPDCGACVATARKEKGRRCTDGIDNDCDGTIDRLDEDCQRIGRRGKQKVRSEGVYNDRDYDDDDDEEELEEED